jgi:hypothetical protein
LSERVQRSVCMRQVAQGTCSCAMTLRHARRSCHALYDVTIARPSRAQRALRKNGGSVCLRKNRVMPHGSQYTHKVLPSSRGARNSYPRAFFARVVFGHGGVQRRLRRHARAATQAVQRWPLERKCLASVSVRAGDLIGGGLPASSTSSSVHGERGDQFITRRWHSWCRLRAVPPATTAVARRWQCRQLQRAGSRPTAAGR